MWSFVLTDLHGVSLGEIRNASGRKASIPLNRMDGGSFTVRLDNRRAEEILSGDCLVKAYETVGGVHVLRTLGEIVTAEEVVDENGEGSIAVVFGGALFRLAKRLIGKSTTGYSQGTALAPVDRGTIMSTLINAVNAEADTGIRIGIIGASSSTFVGPWYYMPVSDRIVELAVALDGPDFEFVPNEPLADVGGVALWTFNTYAAKGSTQPNAIFEFGTGKKNVKSYNRPVTKDGLMNFGYQLPPNFPDNATQTVLSESDGASIAARGRYEDVVPSDLVVDELRQKLLQAHVRVRRAPRQVISFVPHTHNAPQYGVDYSVGDVVHFRAVRGEEVRIDALFRVYGVDFDIDDNGGAQTTIQIIPES